MELTLREMGQTRVQAVRVYAEMVHVPLPVHRQTPLKPVNGPLDTFSLANSPFHTYNGIGLGKFFTVDELQPPSILSLLYAEAGTYIL